MTMQFAKPSEPTLLQLLVAWISHRTAATRRRRAVDAAAFVASTGNPAGA
jgi:hypothetical protein